MAFKLIFAIRAALPLTVLLLLFEMAARSTRVLLGWLTPVLVSTLATELLGAILPFTMILLPLVLVERVWPGSGAQRRYGEGAKFWLAALLVGFAWAKVAAWLLMVFRVSPLVTWNIRADAPAVVIAIGILLSVLILDAFYYWFHRAQHRFAALWKFHRVHHSITHLNSVNSYHHVLEDVLRFPFIALPLALLVDIGTPSLAVVSAFVAGWGMYIHSDTSVHLGRLHWLFADNAYHRVHHAVLERHHHKNYAAYFSMWDRIFRTYKAPEAGSLPDVGLEGLEPPATLWQFLAMPFRK